MKWIVRNNYGDEIGAVFANSEYEALKAVAEKRGFMDIDRARTEYKYFVTQAPNDKQTVKTTQSQSIENLHFGYRDGRDRRVD